MNEIINKRIRQLREEKRWTQTDLARMMHVTPATVCRWESGQKFPEAKKIARLGDLFGVSMDFLYGRTDARETAGQ